MYHNIMTLSYILQAPRQSDFVTASVTVTQMQFNITVLTSVINYLFKPFLHNHDNIYTRRKVYYPATGRYI